MEIAEKTEMVCPEIASCVTVYTDQTSEIAPFSRSSPKKHCKRRSYDIDVSDEIPKKCRIVDLRKDSLSGDLSDENLKGRVKKNKRHSKCTNNNLQLDSQELKKALDGMGEEIDDVLVETAHKNKLTATNIKNILRHVITNEYVLAMVRNTMKTETNEFDDLEEAPFEPKLTRSKVKELREKQHMLPWPMSSPMKQTKTVTKSLLEEEFSDESSSDEDYKPNEDECPSEEDNTALSPKSTDLDSSICEKPASPVVKPHEEDADDESGLRIVVPEPEVVIEDIEVDKIALRTRSKLPLNDTPLEAIEASFIAPDITVDMYDTNCDDEEWQNFLREFNKPIDVVAEEKPEEEPDDAEDDPEYNVLEDDDIPDELDLRFDNAVKITRKELNALMAEIMESAQPEFNDGDDEEEEETEVPEPPARVETPCPIEINEEFVENVRTQWMTSEERIQLEEQMRMYVQLLTQSYLLSFGIPELNYINISSKLLLDELKMFASRAITVNERSAFYAYNLDAALDIVSEYEKEPSIVGTPNLKNKFTGIASAQIKETLFTKNVFMYPKLLPVCGFHKTHETKKAVFTPAEDNLIALGLEQFSFTTSPILYIKDLLVPTKTVDQIKLRIKNSRNQKASLDNPIKYYYNFRKAPPIPRSITMFDSNNVKAPKDLPPQLLPKWMGCMFNPLLTPTINVPLLPKEGITDVSTSQNKCPFSTSQNKCAVSTIKPHKKLRALLPRNNHISPLKHISPILKKYNQKRHIMPSSPVNNSSRTRKCVQFAKRLVIKPPTITSNEPECSNSVNISDKSHMQRSGMNIVNTLVNTDLKRLNHNTAQTEISSQVINCDFDKASKVLSNTENLLNGERTKTSDCNLGLNTNECDVVVESEAVDDGDEEIVDDEPESTVQQDSALTNCTISKKQSANKKKNRHQRDLESSLALLQPNILENDPKKEERDVLFANAYLLRVTEALKQDHDTYEKFLKCLLKYQHSTKSPVKLYFDIKDILKDYPALLNDFIAFLRPEQARECGKYKEYLTLSKIREFIRKIELHFRTQPQHLIKILKTFAQFRQQGGITSPEVLVTLQPLLKNQSHLMEELSGLLPDVAPPEHLMTDFEEITIPNSDDDNSSIDSCEEINIPDVPDPYGGKDCPCDCHTSSTEAKVVNKIRHCVKCGIKFIDGRIYIQTGKVLKPAQVIYHDLPPEPPKIPNNDPKINAKQKQFVSSTITNVVAEQLSKTEVSQVKKDLAKNIPVILQPVVPTEEALPSTSKLPCDVIEDTVFPTVSSCTNKKSIPPDFSHLKDMIAHTKNNDSNIDGKSVPEKIAPDPLSSSTASSSVHVITNQKSQWTSDEDELIIYNFQRFGITEKSFQVSSSLLKTRSQEEVLERFIYLMNLLSKEKQLQ